jgi:TetR/AcrR family transcriptional regulator, repressor of fatR-cypB operon
MNTEIHKLSRKERERLFKRQEIITAARTVFAAKGFTAATLDEIAEQAEFGKGTLYNYFQSKEELFETVMADVFDELIDIAIETCTKPDQDINSSYTELVRRLLRHLLSNIDMYNLLMREMHRVDHQAHFAAVFPDIVLIVQEPLQRAVDAGEIDALPTGHAAFILLSTIFSLFKSSLHIRFGNACLHPSAQLQLGDDEIEAILDDALLIINRTFFNGILPRTNRKRSRQS